MYEIHGIAKFTDARIKKVSRSQFVSLVESGGSVACTSKITQEIPVDEGMRLVGHLSGRLSLPKQGQFSAFLSLRHVIKVRISNQAKRLESRINKKYCEETFKGI